MAEYSTPEKSMGCEFQDQVYLRKPEESYERLMEHLISFFPDVPESNLKKFLK